MRLTILTIEIVLMIFGAPTLISLAGDGVLPWWVNLIPFLWLVLILWTRVWVMEGQDEKLNEGLIERGVPDAEREAIMAEFRKIGGR